jgi:UDP-N-acetylglucosamine diphosphorylase/glucosamine-1-phosphate N-acetyltransferase
MAGFTLWDPPSRESLFPFTYTRPVSECRTGILTIREKWELLLGTPVSHTENTGDGDAFPDGAPGQISLNGSVIPDEELVTAVRALAPGESLFYKDTLVGHHHGDDTASPVRRSYDGPVILMIRPWDLVHLNDREIREDFRRLTRGRVSGAPDPDSRILNPQQVFIEPGARLSCCVINAGDGPVYIGKNAVVMEGALIRGPFALGEGGVVKMGTRIYGATTVGPRSVAGGEIKNSILDAFSNKGHDGYLGDSLIGRWCNLGAGTSCSNLKNNLKPVRILDEATGAYLKVGLKCGLLMGDFSRTAVNTTFHTGSVVGVSTHVFTSAAPPTFLTSFLWAGDDGTTEYELEKALRDADAWKKLKGAVLTETERTLLKRVFAQTSSYRKSFLNS